MCLQSSYGYNSLFTVFVRNPATLEGWRGISQSQIQNSDEKIIIQEVRSYQLDPLSTLSTGSYGFWSEPPIEVDPPGDGNWPGGDTANRYWYTANAPAVSRHFDGANFLFVDGHVKFMNNRAGILWMDVASPSTNPVTQHWWDPTYNG